MPAIYDQQAAENLMPLPDSFDERWMHEWAESGLNELRPYLARRLAFARYCEARER